MIKCRERTTEIEAYHHDLAHELPHWMMRALRGKQARVKADSSLAIRTRAGVVHASVGDWIVRHKSGELMACDQSTFAAKYEPCRLEK